jgi:hypothetical protein
VTEPGTSTQTPGRRRVVLLAGSSAALALAGALLVAGALTGGAAAPPHSPVRPPPAARPDPKPAAARAASARPSSSALSSGLLQRPRAVAAVARPVRLQVPAIAVDTSLQALHRLPDGSLQSPSRWQRAGYYADGVRPGQTGPAVIAGHIDSTSGPAIFYRLRELRPGDRALVTLADGRVLRFVVDRSVTYPKSRFPTDAVYGPTPLPELRLITCTGDFDRQHHNYLDNLVVYAFLASG